VKVPIDDIPLLERLDSMGKSAWNPIGTEAAVEIRRLNKILSCYRAAAEKTIGEFIVEDADHSAACMNWALLEHSQYQCGLCDLRELVLDRETK
jgi:hypothetical protein